ncbi:uncharacterized protein LOC129246156 [Anastrepha obliqua]|uniref:uncharacterized protein LOC129246156 n=1 Tax=Anastrepha obliqua TaxID=95512 RepID=UPI00240987B2|nr:uncharacterized protein LOC129246156 [Anastrepha obliqua]
MVKPSYIVFAINHRVPLIKFRKGGLQAFSHPGKGSDAHNANVTGNAAIEDWQLPQRYARKPIDRAEMDYINNGGPL